MNIRLEISEELLDMNIEESELPVRVRYCLLHGGIQTVRELIDLTEEEFLQIRNLGQRQLDITKKWLEENGLFFSSPYRTPYLPQ